MLRVENQNQKKKQKNKNPDGERISDGQPKDSRRIASGWQWDTESTDLGKERFFITYLYCFVGHNSLEINSLVDEVDILLITEGAR